MNIKFDRYLLLKAILGVAVLGSVTYGAIATAISPNEHSEYQARLAETARHQVDF